MSAASPARLSAERIAAARAAVDLGRLIGATVRLIPRGAEFVGLCPFHAEKTPSFTVVPDRGFYKCFGCGAKGSAIDWIMHRDGRSFREAVDFLVAGETFDPERCQTLAAASARRNTAAIRQASRRLHAARRLWAEARPVTPGDPVWRYLEGRLCLVLPIAPVLRFHPALSHPEFLDAATGRPLRTWPGLVARADTSCGTFAGVHRIYLTVSRTGVSQDADLKARKLAKLSLGPLAGGAIRLLRASDTVGLAEGIEDALSAQVLTGCPTWSCVDNGKLTRVELPSRIRDVTIFADRDPPQDAPGKVYAPEGVGLRAALRLQARLRGQGRRVSILLPEGGQHDFNDELMASLPRPDSE